MSWLDLITNELTLTLGNGDAFNPTWLNATKQTEFNVAEFTFPNVSGSLVDRKQPLGTRYNLELFFQGENHLDTSKKFSVAANDTRYWVLHHPFYGILNVQPLSINYDNSGYNLTKLSIPVIETILQAEPKANIDPKEQILNNKIVLDEVCANSLTHTPDSTDINTSLDKNKKNYKIGIPIIKLPKQFEQYYNLFNTANTYISTAIASPLLAMRAIVGAASLPFQFSATVKERVLTLQSQYQNLSDGVNTLTKPASKQIHQSHGATILSSMAASAITPQDGEYTNSASVFYIIDLLNANYNSYLANLDLLQSNNGGNLTSFVPDPDLQIQLHDIFNLAISSLFQIALTSKQERSIITEADSNIIILTHRLYGLDSTDSNIDELIANNAIGLNQLLQIRKGTRIIYYV